MIWVNKIHVVYQNEDNDCYTIIIMMGVMFEGHCDLRQA